MLLHEKLRLQRKVNKLTLKQAQASSRKERVTKQIERIQKMYSKREANLDAQAKRMQNYASLQFKNFFGLASNMINTNPMGYLNGGINNAGVMQTLMQGIASGQVSLKQKDPKDGKETGVELTNDELIRLLSGQGYSQVTKDGKTYIVEGKAPEDVSTWTPTQADEDLTEKYKFAQSLQNQASGVYQMNQSQCATATSNYENNISIWLEYEKARLEAEQDEALLPLQEQETEWDMESQSADIQLQDAKARLETIKQALSEGIKDSAPTFGLG